MLKLRLFSIPTAFFLTIGPAGAQAPVEDAADDLEVPAAPAPEKAPEVPPAPGTTPTVVAPPAAPPAAETAPERVDAEKPRQVPAAASPPVVPPIGKPPPSVPAVPSVASSESSSVNLERRAHARPVPSGLVLGGYVQAEYNSNQLSQSQLDASQAPLNFDRFVLRRARLRLDHGWDYAAATLELDANTVRGMSVGVRRAEAALVYRGKDAGGVPLVVLSLGVLDVPFGHELAESARVRPFLERSQGSNAIFPTEMDVGVKLSGAVAFLRYGVAVVNGEPVEGRGFPRDPNAAKDVTGRLGVEAEAVPGFVVSGGTSFAVGKGFHPGRPGQKDSLAWRDDDENGQISPDELIGVPGTAASPSQDFDRSVLGLDLQLRLETRLGESHFLAEGFVASNYDRSLYVADPVSTGSDTREAGLSLAFVQELTEYALVGFRYAYYDPNSDLLEQRQGNFLPKSAALHTLSPLIGFELKERARLVFEYDVVLDHLARDTRGVPKDAENDQLGVRLQVEM